MVKPSANLPIGDIQRYKIAEKTIHYFQNNHVNVRPETKNTKTAENMKEAEFDFMIDFKIMIHKTLLS